MHLHFLGICGTFMGSLALIARQLGHRVTGSDSNVYPPMSTQLEQQGIELWQGYEPKHLQPEPDLVVVGNAMSRGNAAVEYMLDEGLDYISGPQWLCRTFTGAALGSGCCRYPRQDHHCEHAGVDIGRQRA